MCMYESLSIQSPQVYSLSDNKEEIGLREQMMLLPFQSPAFWQSVEASIIYTV